MIYKLADAWNVGILVFLVMLGILVSLLNKAGGSAAFGKWASRHIRTRIGAQISVMLLGVFADGTMMVISIASCLAGAVCGDHCSPISDTTIMASAGGHCEHVNHVATQLPYALFVAAVSLTGYFLIGVLQAVGLGKLAWIALPVCVVLLIVLLLLVRMKTGKEAVE